MCVSVCVCVCKGVGMCVRVYVQGVYVRVCVCEGVCEGVDVKVCVCEGWTETGLHQTFAYQAQIWVHQVQSEAVGKR